jgi:hypothetical protein
MNARTTRILKEARPLFWPWCAVILAGVLPLVHPFWAPYIWVIGFFVGIPLLATLSLGNEFQHRTLSLLLSQPVGRMEIWGEKLSVTIVAIVSAVLVFSLALRATSFHPGRQELAFAGAWIVAITASATFWTLFTRSTVGGVALNIGVQSFISFTVPWANLADWLRARGYLSPGNPIVVSTVTFVFLCYAGVMVWLGGRTLARFQATGSMASDDLLMAGPDVMPGAWAGWLRCRPTGAVLNLIRKELRMLRPLWLISLLAALGWACLTLFSLLYERGFSRNFETAVVIMGVGSTLMIAILAGSLSLGEERTSGTHAWHMTLPVSALRQWLIKLCMALFAGFLGAGLVPVLIAGRSLGSSRMFVDVHFGIDLLAGAVLLSLAAFWCACAANGTVAAVLWVIPVMVTLYLAGEFGRWVGSALMNLFVSKFDPFADIGFTNAVLLWFWDSKHSAPARLTVYLLEPSYQPMLTLIWTPTLVLAAIQSYRLFRAQLQDSTRSLIRNLLPLAMVAFLCNSVCMAPSTFVGHAIERNSTVFFETFKAMENIQPGAAKLDATHPLQLTVEDLAKASPLSEHTRRWLRNAHITVALEEAPHHGRYGCGADSKSIYTPYDKSSWYLATIRLANGSHFTVTFEPVHHYTISVGVCE